MNESIVRVHYYPQQFLRTADFTDEQAYHVAMRRRHHIAHHIWGIVYGLEITLEAKDKEFWVQPGIAIDGYGRELILQEKKQINSREFNSKDSDVLDVWIGYNRYPADSAQRSATICQNGEPPADRWREEPFIYLSVAEPGVQDRRKPIWTPDEVLENFSPHYTPVDDPEAWWLVFLGQIQRERADSSKPFEYKRNLADRPYAGLIGEVILAPSRRAHLQIGAERADDPYRFALFVPAALNGPATDTVSQPPEPRLAIRANGEMDVRGEMTVYGDVKLANGAIEFGIGSARSDRTPSWRIYRQLEKVSIAAGQGNTNSAATTASQAKADAILQHQLRIEMEQGRKPGTNQVVIGSWSVTEKIFKPYLTISDDGNTTVFGNLIVTGKIVNASLSAAPPTLETTNATQAAFLTGIAGASTLLQRLYRSPATGDLGIVAQLLDDEKGRESVAGILLETQERSEPFFRVVLTNEQGRKAVINSLAQLETSAKDAFIALLLDKNQDKVIIALLAKDSAAVVVKLLEDESGPKAIVTGLANASENIRKVFIGSLLSDTNARTEIIPALLTLLEELTGDAAKERTAFASKAIDKPKVRTDFIATLLAFLEGLTGNAAKERDKFADLALEKSQVRAAIIPALLALLNGLTGEPAAERTKFIHDFLAPLADEVANPATPRIDEFVKVLKDDFPTLAALLKNKLEA